MCISVKKTYCHPAFAIRDISSCQKAGLLKMDTLLSVVVM